MSRNLYRLCLFVALVWLVPQPVVAIVGSTEAYSAPAASNISADVFPNPPPNLIVAPPPPLPTGRVMAPSLATSPIPSTLQRANANRPSAFAKQTSLTCTPPAAPNEIVELARALDWNPDLIYEYIHNNIQAIPVYGSLKGRLERSSTEPVRQLIKLS